MTIPPSRLLGLLCAGFIAPAIGYDISGVVVDSSGNGIPGVWVGMDLGEPDTSIVNIAMAAITDSNGSWRFTGTTSIAPMAKIVPEARHLTVRGGKLILDLGGRDPSGKLTHAPASRPLAGLGRSQVVSPIFGTIYYIAHGATVSRQSLTAASTQSLRTVLDRDASEWTSWTSDRLSIGGTHLSYGLPECRKDSLWFRVQDEALSVPPGHPNFMPRADHSYLLTEDGMEWDVSYPANVSFVGRTKFHRVSASSGAIPGRYQFGGGVNRPKTSATGADIALMAVDSLLSATRLHAKILLEFSGDRVTISPSEWSSFSKTFIDRWNGSQYSLVWMNALHGSQAKTPYTDSAKYDVTLNVIDSNTVSLTGNRTHEVVTVHGTPSPMGYAEDDPYDWGPESPPVYMLYDMTYSSTNDSHRRASKQAALTTCSTTDNQDPVEWHPVAEWYTPYWFDMEFLPANSRTATTPAP